MTAARLRAYSLLLIAIAIWGIASPVIKFTLDGISPISFLSYRFFISFILSGGVLLLTRAKLNWSFKTFLFAFLYSVLSTTISLTLLFLGLDQTSVLTLSLISIIGPIAVEVAAAVLLGERITRQEKIGSAIALFGTFITLAEPLLESKGFGTFEGNSLILGYLAADIAGSLILKKLLGQNNMSADNLTYFSFVTGFLAFIPIALFFETPQSVFLAVYNLPIQYHLGVWYMAVFSGVVAYTLRARAQKTIEVSEAALFGYLGPLFSIPLAIIWLKETITPLFVFGGIFIVGGVFIAEYKYRKYYKKR